MNCVGYIFSSLLALWSFRNVKRRQACIAVAMIKTRTSDHHLTTALFIPDAVIRRQLTKLNAKHHRHRIRDCRTTVVSTHLA